MGVFQWQCKPTKQHVRLCGGTSCRGRGGRSCRGGRQCEAGGGGCQGGRCRGKGGVCSCDRINGRDNRSGNHKGDHRRRSSQGVDRRSCGRDNRRGGRTRRSVQ